MVVISPSHRNPCSNHLLVALCYLLFDRCSATYAGISEGLWKDSHVHILHSIALFHAELSGNRQHKSVFLTNPLSLKGRNIQYRLFITSTNKTERVLGAVVHFFPDRSHYCRHVHGLLNKGPFYKGLMNGMHLVQLFSSRFKHRAALNYRAGFSRQDQRLYVAHYAPGFLQ